MSETFYVSLKRSRDKAVRFSPRDTTVPVCCIAGSSRGWSYITSSIPTWPLQSQANHSCLKRRFAHLSPGLEYDGGNLSHLCIVPCGELDWKLKRWLGLRLGVFFIRRAQSLQPLGIRKTSWPEVSVLYLTCLHLEDSVITWFEGYLRI